MKIKDSNLMTTIWLNTGSQQLLSGFAAVELLAHACLYLLCLHLFSHTGLNSFMVKEMSGPIFFFLRNSRGWLKEKIILNVLGKGSTQAYQVPF